MRELPALSIVGCVGDQRPCHHFLDFLSLLGLSGPENVKSLHRITPLMDFAKLGKWKLEVRST